VVDDQAENREVVRELLDRVGFETREAASGEEGLRLHDEWSPDLILMDLKMGGIDGLEACRRLRSTGSKVAVVIFTASSIGVEETGRLARAAGADDLQMKPYREAELLRRIGTLLDVTYLYGREEQDAVPGARREVSTLGELLAAVPSGLVAQVREAAIQARATRVEELAAEVAIHSESAADAIRLLAGDYRYGDLVSALGEGHGT
jgi:CheY-like chemotaxis protein